MSEPTVAFAPANGITMAYRRWPAPERSPHLPVVLLHGGLQTGDGMRHLAECLAQSGPVLVPDLRGRGETDQPEDGYDPATMAADVAALVGHLELGPSVVIGRHHGGLVAYHLAAREPEMVSGLILGDATPEVSPERAARIKALVSALPAEFAWREEAERFYEEELRLPAARARHDMPSDLEQCADGRFRWRHNLEVVARLADACLPRSDWAVLERIRCPTLILRGQRGQIRPEVAERMVATIPEAREHTVLCSGHDVFLGPGEEQALAAVQLFLRGQNSPAA
jgi:pimeloyl-ACP methyl ester carboxylesterase